MTIPALKVALTVTNFRSGTQKPWGEQFEFIYHSVGSEITSKYVRWWPRSGEIDIHWPAWITNHDSLESAVMKIQKLFVLAVISCIALPQISAEETVDVSNPSLLAEAVVNQDPESPSNKVSKLFKKDPDGLQIDGWVAIGNGALADHDPTTLRLSPGTTGLSQLGLTMQKEGVLGYRLDLLYGRDADLFRSFGNNSDRWDNSDGFVHNDHAWALPQAYITIRIPGLAIQTGHFLMKNDDYRSRGREGQYSKDRFFATRTVSERNLEPFTLHGTLVHFPMGDNVVTVGTVHRTNTGFDDISASLMKTFIFGATREFRDNLVFNYDALIGDLGQGNLGGTIDDSYYHMASATYLASDRLELGVAHIFQNNPLLDEHASVVRQTAYYVLNDTMTLGQRYENSRQGAEVDETVTVGLNYKRASWANTVLRPEIRWGRNTLGQQTEFFMDVVITF